MKFGMTSLTLKNESVENVIRIVKEAGLSGIEWGVSEGHQPLCDAERAALIRKLSEENGIEIFSLGSYCYMETKEECDQALETAVLLGAPIIRIWAGKNAPADCDDAYRQLIVENTKYMADKAKEHNIVLGFEYHPWTLTETCDEAFLLIESVGKENVGLYWQPQSNLSLEENLRDRDRVLTACVGNMHVQNYNEETGYHLLSELKELAPYFKELSDKPYNLMIEFVKGGEIENLMKDAQALRDTLR